MEASKNTEWFNLVRDYLATHRQLNQVVQGALLLAVIFLIYRWVMSRQGEAIRKFFPALSNLKGKREVGGLLRMGEYATAGERLVALGNLEQAVDIFIQGNLFTRAGDIYLKMKQPERAAMMYERGGDFVRAAEIYMDRKQYEKAEANFEKMKRSDEVGDFYVARNEFPLAARAYMKSKRYAAAAGIFLKIDKPQEAGEAFFKAYEASKKEFSAIPTESIRPEILQVGMEAAKQFESNKDYKRAAEIYREIRKIPDAARCYFALGNPQRAAELCEQASDLENAAKYWALAGKPTTSARLDAERFIQEGRLEEGIAKLQEAGDFGKAAELYLELRQLENAAEMYQRGDQPAKAAALYRDAQQFEKAGAAFEKAKQWNEAIDCYKKANLPDKELVVLERMNDFVGIAQILHRRNESAQALKALENMKEGDANYKSALSTRGKILLDLGKPLEAKEFLDKAVSMAKYLDEEDVDAIYNLSMVAEKTQVDTNALDVLERALLENLVEGKALEKAENVRKVLAERAFTKMSRFSPLPGGSEMFAQSEAAIGEGEKSPAGAPRYIPISEIGRGGMGIVYTAKDTNLDRVVALKILPPSLKKNPRAVQTFLREAKSAASLNHPNIVTVHDTGVQNGDYYIAMEFIDGKTIKEILRHKKKLNYPSVLEVLRQILAGLGYAHSRNVVHRDLTTNNVMWTKQRIIKIMDFGLAKVVKELMSEQSIIGGTPSFMSPEQTLGKPVDHRTDIYSLGICIYEMCLGELPFHEGDLGYHHLHTPPPVPKEKAADIPDYFNTIILKCMKKDPIERFQSAAEIQELLPKP